MRQYTLEPRTYELMTVLSPDVPEAEIAGMLDRIGGYVSQAGGTVREVLRESPWGRRRLAYPIRHGGRDVRDGFYTVYHFDLAPSQVTEVERELKLNDQIIRYLLLQYSPPPVDEKAVEAAEIAAEDAAAAAYAAAQAEAAAIGEASVPATVSTENAGAETEAPAAEAGPAPAAGVGEGDATEASEQPAEEG